MSLRQALVACLLLWGAGPLSGQSLITGAFDYALGGSSVMWIPASEAVFLNPAEISRLHQHTSSITVGRSLALSSLTGNVFIPYVGTIAAGVGRETHETQYTLSYGRIIGRHHALGVGFTYLEKNPRESGISLGATLHFPSSSSRHSGLHLGASLLNFSGDADAASFGANAGAAYWAAPRTLRLQMAYGRRNQRTALSAGLELRLSEAFSLLGGTHAFSRYTGGITFRHSYGTIDLAGGQDGVVFTLRARLDDASQDRRDENIRAGLLALQNQSYFAARSYFLTAVEYDEYAEEARRYAERSLESSRQGSSSAMNEARALEEQGKIPDAIAIYRQIAASEPNNALARQRLALAEARLEAAIATEVRSGDSLRALREYDGAKAAYERALAMDPANSGVRFRLDSLGTTLKDDLNSTLARADAHLRKGRQVQAQRDYESVLKREPGNARAREGLAAVRRLQNQQLFESGKAAYNERHFEQALPIFETVLQQDARHSEARRYLSLTREALKPVVDTYFRSGLQHYLNEEYEQALEDWRKALRIDPDNDAILGYAQRAEEKIRALQELK